MSDLGHLCIVFAEGLTLLANLVEALCFEQHTCIGSGQPDDSESTDQGRSDESVHVMQGEWNFANSSILIPGNKQNVIAFA